LAIRSIASSYTYCCNGILQVCMYGVWKNYYNTQNVAKLRVMYMYGMQCGGWVWWMGVVGGCGISFQSINSNRFSSANEFLHHLPHQKSKFFFTREGQNLMYMYMYTRNLLILRYFTILYVHFISREGKSISWVDFSVLPPLPSLPLAPLDRCTP
jgi:hypothetical protein